MTQLYDPTIQGLLGQCEADWGNPVANRENLVPYGIKPLDRALFGLDIINGELIVLMGPKKMRKTTLMCNILCNIYTGNLPKEKPLTVVDMLESSMNPKRFRDSLISIMATRRLMELGHVPRLSCPQCGTNKCEHMGIYPEFLRYHTRTKEQLDAIEYAIETMMDWKMHIYGANPSQGDTRNLHSMEERWVRLIKDEGAKIFVSDHMQQYAFRDEPTDYEKQIRAISRGSDVVAQHMIVLVMLSQVSLTSLREARTGIGTLTARGGTKAQDECNVALSTKYEDGSGQLKITIEDSRKSGTFSFYHRLDDESGNMYGEASEEPFELL